MTFFWQKKKKDVRNIRISIKKISDHLVDKNLSCPSSPKSRSVTFPGYIPSWVYSTNKTWWNIPRKEYTNGGIRFLTKKRNVRNIYRENIPIAIWIWGMTLYGAWCWGMVYIQKIPGKKKWSYKTRLTWKFSQKKRWHSNGCQLLGIDLATPNLKN